MKARPIRYSDEGEIILLLYPEDTRIRSVGIFDRSVVEEYLKFPATKALKIYCIDNGNFEEVIGLIRFVKSLYNVVIFCYYNRELEEERVVELNSYMTNTIKIGA